MLIELLALDRTFAGGSAAASLLRLPVTNVVVVPKSNGFLLWLGSLTLGSPSHNLFVENGVWVFALSLLLLAHCFLVAADLIFSHESAVVIFVGRNDTLAPGVSDRVHHLSVLVEIVPLLLNSAILLHVQSM